MSCDFATPSKVEPESAQTKSRTQAGRSPPGPAILFADYFDEHALAAAAIEFAVENLFPRPEVQFGFGDGHYDLPSHDLPLQVGVGVVLSGAIVFVLGSGRVGREPFEPGVIVMKQPILGVVDVNAGRNVHGVHEAKALFDVAFANELFARVGDV